MDPLKKMKVLITTDLYTTNTNGVVTSVQNLFDELTAKGHDVRILTLSDTTRSHREGCVTYIRSVSLGAVYPNVRMPISYRHRLIRELIDWKPDVIHSQCEFFSFQFASRIAKHTGAPIVHTYHTLYEQYVGYVLPSRRLGERIVRGFSRKRLKKVSAVVAPTRKVETTLRGYGLANAIRVVPSGISLEQHCRRLTPRQRMEKRAELGIGEDRKVVLNLGRLGTEKNLGELLELFAKALEQDETLVFLIVGDGPAREGLEKQARELGITEQVIFTGMVDPRCVQEYYQLGDVFVSASTSETQGLTYIEAAANGLPLLCRKDDCLLDVLRQGQNGYAYTCEADFLRAMEKVMSDDTWRSEAGENSRQVAAGFGKKAFGEAVESLYQSVL
jgi:1,2-diacylglycerol 3-alpha-glucosyltransferase